nr:MAG TPA: hypothetical protein [Ackermannviridae sp.]
MIYLLPLHITPYLYFLFLLLVIFLFVVNYSHL